LISGAHEKGIVKDLDKPYPEPTQVPLGEKPKVMGLIQLREIGKIAL